MIVIGSLSIMMILGRGFIGEIGGLMIQVHLCVRGMLTIGAEVMKGFVIGAGREVKVRKCSFLFVIV